MRLRTLCPAAPRAWTVELRSQTGELVLVCQQCPPGGLQVTAASARSAALAHLARHARGDLRAPHLRTCQCHERGCRWHRRHRGCAGPIQLLLASERGGRVWRLADACGACAAATVQAAVVPDTVLAGTQSPPAMQVGHISRPEGPRERVGVGEILSYLAVALPPDVSPDARLLAMQCALRMKSRMRVELPAGLLRSLRIDAVDACRELEQAWWLSVVEGHGGAGTAARLRVTLLAQPPVRPNRRRAADWALRSGCPARIGTTRPLPRLLGVYLTVHSDPTSGDGLREGDRVIRDCGIPEQLLPGALDQLLEHGVLEQWRIRPGSEDVHWTLALGQR